MKVVSQPFDQVRGAVVPLDQITSYAYQDEDLGRVRLYIIDTGVDPGHDVYRTQIVEPEWLWPGKFEAAPPPDPNGPPPGNSGVGQTLEFPYYYRPRQKIDWASHSHGTKMFSRAVGPTVGISLKAAITVVALPEARPRDERERQEMKPRESSRVTSFFEALQAVADDIQQKGIERRAVVLMAQGFGWRAPNFPPQPTDGEWYIAYQLLQRLVTLGAHVVAAAGNQDVSSSLHMGEILPRPAVVCC